MFDASTAQATKIRIGCKDGAAVCNREREMIEIVGARQIGIGRGRHINLSAAVVEGFFGWAGGD